MWLMRVRNATFPLTAKKILALLVKFFVKWIFIGATNGGKREGSVTFELVTFARRERNLGAYTMTFERRI